MSEKEEEGDDHVDDIIVQGLTQIMNQLIAGSDRHPPHSLRDASMKLSAHLANLVEHVTGNAVSLMPVPTEMRGEIERFVFEAISRAENDNKQKGTMQ